MRPPEKKDLLWITEAYADWHEVHGDHFPITVEDVKRFITKWLKNKHEKCLVEPGIGLVTYRVGPYESHMESKTGHLKLTPFSAIVDNLVIHPNHRNLGWSKKIRQELKQHLFEQGVMAAVFHTLPGPMRDEYGEQGTVTVWD